MSLFVLGTSAYIGREYDEPEEFVSKDLLQQFASELIFKVRSTLRRTLRGSSATEKVVYGKLFHIVVLANVPFWSSCVIHIGGDVVLQTADITRCSWLWNENSSLCALLFWGK
jgi:hypothetical protein